MCEEDPMSRLRAKAKPIVAGSGIERVFVFGIERQRAYRQCGLVVSEGLPYRHAVNYPAAPDATASCTSEDHIVRAISGDRQACDPTTDVAVRPVLHCSGGVQLSPCVEPHNVYGGGAAGAARITCCSVPQLTEFVRAPALETAA